MADLTHTSVLNRIFQERIPDLKLRSAKTLMKFSNLNLMRSQGWQTIDWLVSDAGSTVGTEAITDNTTADSRDTVYPAQLFVGRYREKHTMTVLLQDLQVARNRGVGAIKQLLKRQVDDALIALTRKMNNLIYTGIGDGSKGAAGMGDFLGLNYIANIQVDANNVGKPATSPNLNYAGISTATVPKWAPLTVSNGGTPTALTRDNLLKLEELVQVNESGWDTILCNPRTATQYNKIFYDLAGGASLALEPVGNSNFKPVDLGHNGRYYSGIPLTEDPMCPVGTMYFLDSSQIEFVSFTLDPLPNLLLANEQTGSLTEVTSADKTYGLPFWITQLPANNPDALTFTIRTYPQMVVRNRKAVAVLTDIAVD
jgi:hypothetical protein